MRNWIELMLLAALAWGPAAGAAPSLKLRFPIADEDRARISGLPIMGLDHDENSGGKKTQCKNHHGNGWPFCYNGHRGTDFVLHGGFAMMDRGSAQVVAAASGVVVGVEDGNYDRCAVDPRGFAVSCHGHKMRANQVTIEHDDGTRTRYLHLKKGSVAVKKGERVFCGQALGLVGSSGHSSMPHLHFDVFERGGERVDPYSGPNSQSYSYWRKEYMADGLPSGSCKDAPRSRPVLSRCQWETVTSAAECGTRTVENALVCGTETVTSAARCGTQWVSCGTKTVTDAAVCGVKTVTSAARCGTELILGAWQCAMSGFGWVDSCEVPKSCDVPETCEIEQQCEAAARCEVALECEVAETCQVNRCRPRLGIRRFDFTRD